MTTNRRKQFVVLALIIASFCSVCFWINQPQTVMADSQRQLAMGQTHQLFNRVKVPYLRNDYSAAYKTWKTDAGDDTLLIGSDGGWSYASRSDERLIPAIKVALQRLSRVDPTHLPACDRRLLNLMEPRLRSRLNIFQQRVARQLNPDAHDSGAVNEATAGPFKVRMVIDPNKNRLSAVTKRLTGAPLTPDQLLGIAAVERDRLSQELRRLEARVIDLGLAPSLDEYAAHPDHFATDSNAILDAYIAISSGLSPYFRDDFYAYDVSDVDTVIETKSHSMMARGAYYQKANQVILYHDRDVFDLKSLGFLAVHEYFPGHHFEHEVKPVTGVCPYETGGSFSVEAWSTYTEYLADKAGVFDDPGQRLGWLDYRLVRVGRIYIDIRQLEDDLSKEELRAVWEGVMPGRLHDIFDSEYERIFSSKPYLRRFRHHHLNYLLGYQTIEATKARVQTTLGDQFDAKKFHHLLLTGSHLDAEKFYDNVIAGMDADGAYPFHHKDLGAVIARHNH